MVKIAVLLLFALESNGWLQPKIYSPLVSPLDLLEVNSRDLCSLHSIRDSIARQEPAIVFGMFARSQFCVNHAMYTKVLSHDVDKVHHEEHSVLERVLLQSEILHGQLGRYVLPEEHPILTDTVQVSAQEQLPVPKHLINLGRELLVLYPDKVVRHVCAPGDDGNYGSATICDVQLLQAISRRIHMGKFVAEAKYLQDPELYMQLVQSGDMVSLLASLTNTVVEYAVLEKIRRISEVLLDCGVNNVYTMHPTAIVNVYRDFIIPLTKDVEIRYLHHRVGVDPPPALLRTVDPAAKLC